MTVTAFNITVARMMLYSPIQLDVLANLHCASRFGVSLLQLHHDVRVLVAWWSTNASGIRVGRACFAYVESL